LKLFIFKEASILGVGNLEKEIIILAKSKKFYNLCIAGIDTSNGEWIRIVSDDDSISHAVKIEDAVYEDGSVSNLFDVVKIECKGKEESYYQVENYIYDSNYYWLKVRQASIKEILRIHPIEDKDFIFYNSQKKIPNTLLLEQREAEKYSLMLISPKNMIIHVRQWPNKKDVTMSFIYNGIFYKYLSVTDIEYEQRFLSLEPGDYKLKEGTLLVLSLGDCYYKDNCHYKLIASIIER
jgi:hypothetical protein